MGATRLALISGPGKVVYNSAEVYTKNDFSIDIEHTTADVSTSAHGFLRAVSDSQILRTRFVPEGRMTAAVVAAFWPHLASVAGTDIHSTSDVPAVIHDATGNTFTILAAGVSQMPSLNLSAIESAIGEVELIGVRATGDDWSTVDSLFTLGALGYFTDTSFSDSLIVTQTYSAAFGAVAGLTAFGSQDGFRVEFPMQVVSHSTDPEGILKYTLQSVGCIVRCIPIGPTPAQILAAEKLMGVGIARGQSISGTALTITGADGFVFTLPSCHIRSQSFRFGSSQNYLRQGEIAFVAAHNFTTGDLTGIATFTTV